MSQDLPDLPADGDSSESAVPPADDSGAGAAGKGSEGSEGANSGPWVEVMLKRVVIQEDTDRQCIFLNERRGDRGFAIVIGNHEASEIQRVLARVESERPLTHRLLHDAIAALGGELTGIKVVTVHESTYYARLELSRDGAPHATVDARPSDAIALALRARCPIHVSESVLTSASS
jgi:bifunctional DNase/RNase